VKRVQARLRAPSCNRPSAFAWAAHPPTSARAVVKLHRSRGPVRQGHYASFADLLDKSEIAVCKQAGVESRLNQGGRVRDSLGHHPPRKSLFHGPGAAVGRVHRSQGGRSDGQFDLFAFGPSRPSEASPGPRFFGLGFPAPPPRSGRAPIAGTGQVREMLGACTCRPTAGRLPSGSWQRQTRRRHFFFLPRLAGLGPHRRGGMPRWRHSSFGRRGRITRKSANTPWGHRQTSRTSTRRVEVAVSSPRSTPVRPPKMKPRDAGPCRLRGPDNGPADGTVFIFGPGNLTDPWNLAAYATTRPPGRHRPAPTNPPAQPGGCRRVKGHICRLTQGGTQVILKRLFVLMRSGGRAAAPWTCATSRSRPSSSFMGWT